MFGKIDGQVTNPLQVIINLQSGDYESQINSNRLIQCQDFQTLLFHINFHVVDFKVHFDHRLSEIRVPLPDRFDRPAEILLNNLTQGYQHLFQPVDFSFHMYCHRLRLRLSKSSRNVVFGFFLFWFGEELLGRSNFYEIPFI